MESNPASRRTVLQLTGGALGAVTATGGVSGEGSGVTDDRSGPVELNVGFEDETGKRAIRDAAAEVLREFDFPSMTIRAPEEAATSLRNRAGVSYVEPNGRMHAMGQTVPWNVEKVGGDTAPCDGVGVDVAVLDTGIDSDHPEFHATLGSGRAFETCTGSCNRPWDDDHGHGTAVAGVIGASDDFQGIVGNAPGVTLHAVKVLDSVGGGSISNIAAGIQYAANQGWEVINMSLAGGQRSSTIANAVQFAHGQGSLLVAAVGFNGPCAGCVGYPAAEPEVIAVTGVDDTGSLVQYVSQGPAVELAAPGTGFESTWVGGGYETVSGTSVASPHVAAAAALLMARGHSNSQTRTRLHETATPISGLSAIEQGHGLVNVDAMCFG